MAAALRLLIRATLPALCYLGSTSALAVCVSPLLTPTECDFKNENTHLWLNQPGWRINETKRVRNLIESATQTIDQYHANLKTTGSGVVGGIDLSERMNQISDAIEQAVAVSTAGMGQILANDPYNLKAFLDISVCTSFWQVTYDEQCPSPIDLLSDIEQLDDLQDLALAIREVRNNPDLVLGEEWGAIREDIELIRSEFNSAKTLANTLDIDTKINEYQRRFSDLGEMLAKPQLTIDRWEAERAEISATLNDTIRDTVKSMHELSSGDAASPTGLPRVDDATEIARLSDMNRRALGRMQAMEIGNMTANHTAQVWAKLVEHQMNMGHLIAADYASEMQATNTGRAMDIQRLVDDPMNPTTIGNEAALPRP